MITDRVMKTAKTGNRRARKRQENEAGLQKLKRLLPSALRM